MTVGEAIDRATGWFAEGIATLLQGNFLDLTLGQMAFTLIFFTYIFGIFLLKIRDFYYAIIDRWNNRNRSNYTGKYTGKYTSKYPGSHKGKKN